MNIQEKSQIETLSHKLDKLIIDFEKHITMHETKEKYTKIIFGLVPTIQSLLLIYLIIKTL